MKMMICGYMNAMLKKKMKPLYSVFLSYEKEILYM